MSTMRYHWAKAVAWGQQEIAWQMPRWLARWAFARVVTEAATGKYHGMDLADIKCLDALAAWEGNKDSMD